MPGCSVTHASSIHMPHLAAQRQIANATVKMLTTAPRRGIDISVSSWLLSAIPCTSAHVTGEQLLSSKFVILGGIPYNLNDIHERNDDPYRIPDIKITHTHHNCTKCTSKETMKLFASLIGLYL